MAEKRDGVYAYVTGHVAGEPELRYTPQGKAVVTILLSVPEGRDGKVWTYRLTLWEAEAEAAAREIRDGTRMEASGYLEHREYKERLQTCVNVRKWTIIDSPKTARPKTEEFDDADIPF